MSIESNATNLTDTFLIAMPGLEDEIFESSIVYLCEHNPQGAMGIVINKPSDLSFYQLFEKVDLPLGRQDLSDQVVMLGGPIHTDRGFVLHESLSMTLMMASDAQLETNKDWDASYSSSIKVGQDMEMTSSKDVLEALSEGNGPNRVLISLGYASWGAGQLETEIAANQWLTIAANKNVIFETPFDKRYNKALSLLGISTASLSPSAGRA
jgi:putative transcriptional regulator